jgi:hypothetical protein
MHLSELLYRSTYRGQYRQKDDVLDDIQWCEVDRLSKPLAKTRKRRSRIEDSEAVVRRGVRVGVRVEGWSRSPGRRSDRGRRVVNDGRRSDPY